METCPPQPFVFGRLTIFPAHPWLPPAVTSEIPGTAGGFVIPPQSGYVIAFHLGIPRLGVGSAEPAPGVLRAKRVLAVSRAETPQGDPSIWVMGGSLSASQPALDTRFFSC